MRSLQAVVVILLMSFAAIAAPPAMAADAEKTGLLVNLTTDDTSAATMAIAFAHQGVLKAGHKPVAIFLNVRAVHLADKNRPSPVPGPMREQNLSIQEMLTAFINDGGEVIVCPMCANAAGMTPDDVIPGAQMATPERLGAILFDPNVKTLSY